jgi:hypothetical protein
MLSTGLSPRQPPNTYTYRQSELPPMTDEIQSEIAEVDFNVANLILKIQGNYLALSLLAETLADCLNSAESNLCSIRIIPDGGEPKFFPQAISFTDLPTREKQLLVSTALTCTVAIKVIATLLRCSTEEAVAYVSNASKTQSKEMTPEQVDDVVERLAKSLCEHPDESFFAI